MTHRSARVLSFAVSLLTLLVTSGGRADADFETDKWEQFDSVRDGGWTVAFGDDIGAIEYLEGTAAFVCSCVAENPGPFVAWVEEKARSATTALAASIKRNIAPALIDDATKYAVATIRDLVNGKTEGVRERVLNTEFDMKAGVVSHRGYEYRKVGGKEIRLTPPVRAYTPYVAFRLSLKERERAASPNVGWEITADRTSVGEWETIVDGYGDSDGRHLKTFRVYNVAKKSWRYLCAEGGGGTDIHCNRDKQGGGWELFDLIKQDDDTYAIRAFNGQYLCAEGGGGGRVVADRTAVGPWEKFKLEYVDSKHGDSTKAIALKTFSKGLYVCFKPGP